MIKKTKLGQGLPINVIVMIIIGIIIFGLGIGLFARISGSGEEQVANLESKVRTDIAKLECEGDNWICVPQAKLNVGERKTFEIFIVNRDQQQKSFRVKINGNEDGTISVPKSDYGDVTFNYYFNPITIASGKSASIPYSVSTTQVKEGKTNFIAKVELFEDDIDTPIASSPINIRVE
jgi:hypothetical protein